MAASSPAGIQALIRATEERTRAEERTQQMLMRIAVDFEQLRDLIRSCDIPGLRQMIVQLEAGMSVIVDHLGAREQQDAGRLTQYREMARERMHRERGGIRVGDIKANNVQVSGHDSLMNLLEGRPEVAALVDEIELAKDKGRPFDDLLAKLLQIAPDVAKLLMMILGLGGKAP